MYKEGKREMCEDGNSEICIEKTIIMNGHEMMGKEDNEKVAAKDYCKNKMV